MSINSKNGQIQFRNISHGSSPYLKQHSTFKTSVNRPNDSNFDKYSSNSHHCSSSNRLIQKGHSRQPSNEINESLILNAKCILVNIQNQIQISLESQTSPKDNIALKIYHKLTQQIQNQIKQLIAVVRKIPDLDRMHIFIQLMASMAQTSSTVFLLHIPFQQIQNFLSCLSHLFRRNLKQIAGIQKQFSQSQDKICQQSEQKPINKSNNRKLHASDSLHNLSKFSNTSSNKYQTCPTNAGDSKRNQNAKELNQFIQILALNKIDIILMYIFSDNQIKSKLLSANTQTIHLIKNILNGLQNPTVSKKIQLLYTEEEFSNHLFNIQSLSLQLSQYVHFKCLQAKTKENSHLNEIQLLQKDIRQLIALELQNRQKLSSNHANQAQGSSRSSDKLISSNFHTFRNSNSLSKKNTIKPPQSFHLTQRGGPFHSKSQTTTIQYFTNRVRKWKNSTGGFISNSPAKSNDAYHLNERFQTNSASKCSQNSKGKISPQSYQRINEFLNQPKLAKSDSKGMNYNKVIPFRNSIIPGRSSILTNSIKNLMSINNNNLTNFDSFGNVPNQIQEESYSKNSFGVRIPNFNGSNIGKQNKAAQRRSGFVGLNRKPSAKRISTRWNNGKEEVLFNLFSQSSFKKIDDGNPIKKQIKSKFSLSKDKRQREDLSDKQQNSHSSSSKSGESLKKKASNQTEISFIGQTYNIFGYNKFSVPKIGSKQSTLNLSNRSIPIIDEKFQEMRCKLFYIRLMTLLNEVLKIVITRTYSNLKCNIQKKKHRYRNYHQEPRKKTFYESKYHHDRNQLMTNQKRIFSKGSRQIDSIEKRQYGLESRIQHIYQGLKKLKKNQKKEFSQVEAKLQQIMGKYLTKKEQSFQAKIYKIIKQIKKTQINTKLIQEKVLQCEQELIIKPFHLFLQIENEEGSQYQHNSSHEKRQKIFFYVIGNNKMDQENGSLIDKCTKISLQYQDESQSDIKIAFNEDKNIDQHQNNSKQISNMQFQDKTQQNDCDRKKYSTVNNLTVKNKNDVKKMRSILQPEQQRPPIKILELPLSLIIKSDGMEDKIIYKKINLSISLSLDLNEHSSKSKQKHKDLHTIKSLKKSVNASNSKLVSGYFGIKDQSKPKFKDEGPSNSAKQSPSESSEPSSQRFIEQHSSGDASDQDSNSNPYSNSFSASSESQSISDSANLSDDEKSHQRSQSSSNNVSSSSKDSQPSRKRFNRSLSIESSTIEQIQKLNENNVFFNLGQNLGKGRIKKNKQQNNKKNCKNKDLSNQSFLDGYFCIERLIEKLLEDHFKAVKSQMGTKIIMESSKNASKASFEYANKNKSKAQILKNVKISKFSQTFKNLLQALPRDFCKVQQILQNNSTNQQNKKHIPKTDFANFLLQIKVDDQRTIEKISQKRLIRLKYNKQTSKKSMFKLNDNSFVIIKSYQKVNLIRKINTYLFLKDILFITSKGHQKESHMSTIMYEQIYCNTFHELYERQIIDFVQINSLAKKTQKSSLQNTKNGSFLFEKKFKNLFFTQKLQKLKKLNLKPFNRNPINQKLGNLDENNRVRKVNNRILQEEDQYSEQLRPQVQLYQILVEQIPQSSSKTETLNIEFIQHYSYNEGFVDPSSLYGNHLHFANKDKLKSVFTYAQRLSKIKQKHNNEDGIKDESGIVNHESKSYFSVNNTNSIDNFISGNLQQSRIIKNGPVMHSSCNFHKNKSKRTTIEINKIDISELSSEIAELGSNQKSSTTEKSKRNLGFAVNSTDSFGMFFSLRKDLSNENTQNDIAHQTQKSFKSIRSRTRLHRQGHHINSLIPTSTKNIKSFKYGEYNSNSCYQGRHHCPFLAPSLNSYNLLKNRKKYKKSFFVSSDNFIDLRPNQLQQKYQEDILKTISKWGVSKKCLQIQLIKKDEFYKKNIKSFKTIIKRSKKYITCFVQWWPSNEYQHQIQIIAGMYSPNLPSLKIISGKIHNIFFRQIFKCHSIFENYINCELDCSFEINSGPMRDCMVQKERLIANSLNPVDFHDHFIIRPLFSLQKMIKVRLISRFVKLFRASSGLKTSEKKASQNHYIVVSIFIYEFWRNENVYFHVYVPKNSKNFVFVVQGSIFYAYLNESFDQYRKDKNCNQSIKNTSIGKSSEKKIINHNKKRKPRLSIFSPLSQISNRQEKSQQDFLVIPIRTNENIISSQFFSVHDPLKSIDSNLSLKKKSSSILESENDEVQKKKLQCGFYEDKSLLNWQQICKDIFRIRKKIKFQQLFQINAENDSYFVEFSHNEKIRFEGFQILAKKVHFSFDQEIDDTLKDKKLKIIPTAIEIVALEYPQKKFALLNSFHSDAFNKLIIKQRFIKYEPKLQNSHFYSYNLEDLLTGSVGFNKSNRKSITKRHFQEQNSKIINKSIHCVNETLITTSNEPSIKVSSQKSRQGTKGKKLQKKALQTLIKSHQPCQNNLLQISSCQSQLRKELKNQVTEKTEVNQFSANLLSTKIIKNDMVSSFMKKMSSLTKYKSIFYSELIEEFRKRCQFTSYKKFEKKERQQKKNTIFINSSKFSLSSSQIVSSINNRTKIIRNSVPNELGKSFIKIIFRKVQRSQQQIEKVDLNEDKRLEVRMQKLSGQNICQLDPEKMEELFPFVSMFSGTQTRRFLQRIVKDESTIEYLKIRKSLTSKKIN